MARLGDVAEINRGMSWSRDQELPGPTDDSVPVLRIGNVQRHGFEMNDVLHIRGVSFEDRRRHELSGSTLVLVGSNGNPDRVGNVYLTNEAVLGHIMASFLIGIKPKEHVSERFLALSLRGDTSQKEMTQSTSGSTGLKNLSLGFLRSLPVPLPPLEEQRGIAAVLDSIDEAIEWSEAVIASTERLRDALLHELLTRGIPGRHSEYRDVPGLGTIPASWEVKRLGEVCRPPEYGAAAPARPFDPSMPRYVRITDLTDDGRLRPEDARSADPDEVAGFELEPGDLLFARSGATVGKTYMYRDVDGPCVFAGYLIRFQSHREQADPRFLSLWTHSATYRKWVDSMFRAGAQPNINAAEYASMTIPLPPLPEQQAIADTVDAIDDAIQNYRMQTNNLQALKDAAAEALLTGRMRVRGK